ncbi:GNAT family N-acetyltransferase [Streptosporangium longisporum]|uniref:GNAT family N-acetyltransferase n=1 Tax=Streptosporangium longisporum TaxID=46187 RepID=A0ABP6KPK0_9ACTN
MNHVLTTGRLVLRPVRARDLDELRAHWTSPEVRRFLFDGDVLSAAEIAEIVETSEQDFAASGYGVWTVRKREGIEQGAESQGAELLGTAGLRSLEGVGVEVVYSLAPSAWGYGYATEAARAVVEHALDTLGLPEVLAEVDEGNAASVAVAERLGMTPFETIPGLLGPMTRYRRTR